MVGNDVEDLAEAELAQPLAEALMTGCASKLFIDGTVVDDIVTVHAAGRGLEIRRTVDVADAERLEVLRGGRGVVEGETFVQLQSIRRRWSLRHIASMSLWHG
jgi:hypothetical protein